MIDVGMDQDFISDAKENTEAVCNAGATAYLLKGTSDKFGEPGTIDSLAVKAFPIRYSPFNRSVISKVSWATEVDVMMFISKKTQDDNNRTFLDLKKYSKIQIDKQRYDILHIAYHIACGNDYLYYAIGGKKTG